MCWGRALRDRGSSAVEASLSEDGETWSAQRPPVRRSRRREGCPHSHLGALCGDRRFVRVQLTVVAGG